MPRIKEFHEQEEHTDSGKLLIQAIAALSVIEPRTHMTPEEIWDEFREQTYRVYSEEAKS